MDAWLSSEAVDSSRVNQKTATLPLHCASEPFAVDSTMKQTPECSKDSPRVLRFRTQNESTIISGSGQFFESCVGRDAPKRRKHDCFVVFSLGELAGGFEPSTC